MRDDDNRKYENRGGFSLAVAISWTIAIVKRIMKGEMLMTASTKIDVDILVENAVSLQTIGAVKQIAAVDVKKIITVILIIGGRK